MINNIKHFITENKRDIEYIILLTIFLSIIAVPKLLIQYKIGIGNWDTYLYLENGRNFARMGWGDVPSIAPVLPMILSKMFLISGTPYQEAIFNIDVVFYMIGIISFYLLLRLRFDENTSILGSVILSTFTLLFSWVAIGGNDIIGVSGTILTVYLIIVSHRYDHRLYYLALPVAAYSFLSRYTAGVMIFSIAFYLVISKISRDEIKYILKGALVGTVSVSWFLYQFYIHLGTPFPFLGQFSGTVSNTVVLDSGYLPDSWYYIKHIPNYLLSYVPNVDTFNAIVNPMGNIPSVFSYVYILLFVTAFVIIGVKFYKTVKSSNIEFNTYSKLRILVSAMLLLAFIISLGSISYIISTIVFLLSLYLMWNVLDEYDIEYLNYDLLMLSLFVIYLIFQSILFTKNDRYFITVLPFIAYFITYTINSVFMYMKSFNNGSRIIKIAVTVIIIALLFNTFIFINEIPTENKYHNIEEACSWLEDNRDLNNSTVIYSDNWPAVTWYLNIYTQNGVINTTNSTARINFSYTKLHSNSSHKAGEYYIDTTSAIKENYAGLEKIKHIHNVEIYENKYLKYGKEYLKSDEYNIRLSEEINKKNVTSDFYV